MEVAEKIGGRIADLQGLKGRMRSWLSKDEERGIFKMDRAAFTEATLFDLEMKYIFERNARKSGREAERFYHHPDRPGAGAGNP
jgi:hypothetical protein